MRLWNVGLQRLADETGLVIRVHLYPPGTSKWNKVEHRLFAVVEDGRNPLINDDKI
ncbi:hypothetical protein ACFSQQ_01300 [Mesorhizobium kowhaii]|uniref:ISAzo13-like element transposase-related protein n=1 Tax=Mesorhizobium kowhaii TaxID=1300272 RepID=UPI00362CAA37